MQKELTPEMFNYNKYPGPEFIYFDNQVKSDAYQFTLLENVKEAFDAKVFSQRFSEILLKYDYIVGDWGNDQLRLRGFYKDSDDVRRQDRISRLEDYLKEYCNYGCAYFILENPNPELIIFEEERFKPVKKKKRRRHRRPENPQKESRSFVSKKRQDSQPKRKQHSRLEIKKDLQVGSNKPFKIRKKEK